MWEGGDDILDVVAVKPATQVTLHWTAELAFAVTAGAREIVTDGDSHAGLSPVELLGAALAGCMATDVVHILTRGRQDLRALDVTLTAHRAPEAPRRFVGVRVHFAVVGQVSPTQLERAIALSHDKSTARCGTPCGRTCHSS